MAIRRGRRIVAAALVAGIGAAHAAAPWPIDETARVADVDAFCRFVADDDAYLDRTTTDWPAACAAARREAARADTRDAFIAALERALRELYDPHAHLGTSNARSPRLVPTGSDVVAEWRDATAWVVDVRARSAAAAAGVRPGQRIVSIDDRPVEDAAADWMPSHLRAPDPAAHAYGLAVALAGRQDDRPVRLDVDDHGTRRTLSFVPGVARPDDAVTVSRSADVGIVRIDNSLGDMATVAAFDAALLTLDGARALVLDLRDTPSGGTSSVARGVMGRLVANESPYQRHEEVAEQRATGIRRVWVEYVEPRGVPFTGPVVVLVGRWTGSMGEGIAIGLNAARGAPVVGQPMGRLRGALDETVLPASRIIVRIPTERLSHVDGTPREAFVPSPIVHDVDGTAELAAAVALAASLAAR